MKNLLKNGGFEADWGDEGSHVCLVFPGGNVQQIGNIFTPPGWLTWFRHEAGTWDQPEVRDARKSADARRVHSGEKGMLLFTFYRKHDAGYLQQVDVEPGSQLHLTAWAHAWSNWQDGPHPDDGRWSEGEGVGFNAFFGLEGEVTNDNTRNFTFCVGIDPAGGTDPLADTVVWGQGAHIYNEYAQVPPVEVIAQTDKVTVFLRSKTLWAFKHNDAYWDDVELVVTGVVKPDEPDPPTPTEPARWNYPVIETGSKLGIHTIRPSRVLDYAKKLAGGGAQFSVVKAVDDFSTLIEIKKSYTDTITIGRLTSSLEHCQEVSRPGADLDRLADRLLGIILDKIRIDPLLMAAVDYWEICNEPDPPGVDGYTRLSELMIICMKKAEVHKLKIALFSLNFGTPEWDEMKAMVESGVFARAREGGHIMAMHEGLHSASDPIDKWHGDRIPDGPIVDGAGPLCFRYRFLYSLIPDEHKIPLVVSEWCGYDQRKLSPSEILERIVWYDTLGRRDYFLWAFCPFTLGPTGQWSTHDYAKVMPSAVDYMTGTKDEPNALPSNAPPEPQPGRGAPREQYERTVMLLPPNADASWAIAAVEATWDSKRISIIPSADDAGLGDLDVRNVIAVNPSVWPTDLKVFYDTYYPGVNVEYIEAASPVELLALLSEVL